MRHINSPLGISVFAFQSTHPVWGATDIHICTDWGGSISIHAPRMGCDAACGRHHKNVHHFNPRTPYGVRLLIPSSPLEEAEIFQSTHPVWGATLILCGRPPCYVAFQSTHPVWGATTNADASQMIVKFQSTHPVWGATRRTAKKRRPSTNFNPRTPYGVRPMVKARLLIR